MVVYNALAPQRRQAAAIRRSSRIHHDSFAAALVQAAAWARAARRLDAVQHATGIQPGRVRRRDDIGGPRRTPAGLADGDGVRADFRRSHSPCGARLARRADRDVCVRVLRRHRRSFPHPAQRTRRGLPGIFCAADPDRDRTPRRRRASARNGAGSLALRARDGEQGAGGSADRGTSPDHPAVRQRRQCQRRVLAQSGVGMACDSHRGLRRRHGRVGGATRSSASASIAPCSTRRNSGRCFSANSASIKPRC